MQSVGASVGKALADGREQLSARKGSGGVGESGTKTRASRAGVDLVCSESISFHNPIGLMWLAF
jgi:hypothetical protein